MCQFIFLLTLSFPRIITVFWDYTDQLGIYLVELVDNCISLLERKLVWRGTDAWLILGI